MDASIRIIVFDLGGVMIRLAKGWEEACALADVPYHPYTPTADELAHLLELEVLLETSAISTEEHLTQLCALLHDRYTTKEMAAVYQATIQEELPGIYELVTALRQAGYRTACLSNTCAAHWVDLTNPTLYPGIGSLDFQHASHLFGIAKPDPRIYRQFESATGFSPVEILFFDDRQENIDAARACGWHAVRIPDPQSASMLMHAALAQHGIQIALHTCP